MGRLSVLDRAARRDPWWDLEGQAARRRRRLLWVVRTITSGLCAVAIGVMVAVVVVAVQVAAARPPIAG